MFWSTVTVPAPLERKRHCYGCFFALWVTCGGEAAEKVDVFREMNQQNVTICKQVGDCNMNIHCRAATLQWMHPQLFW